MLESYNKEMQVGGGYTDEGNRDKEDYVTRTRSLVSISEFLVLTETREGVKGYGKKTLRSG